MGKGDEERAGGVVGTLDAGGPGCQAPLLLLPEAAGARSGQGAPVGCTAFLVAASFSEAVCPPPHSEGQVASMDSAVAPLLCAFQSIPFGCRRVEFCSALLCWAEVRFLSCGCFTGYRLKGRDKGGLYHGCFTGYRLKGRDKGGLYHSTIFLKSETVFFSFNMFMCQFILIYPPLRFIGIFICALLLFIKSG